MYTVIHFASPISMEWVNIMFVSSFYRLLSLALYSAVSNVSFNISFQCTVMTAREHTCFESLGVCMAVALL